MVAGSYATVVTGVALEKLRRANELTVRVMFE